MTIWQPGMRCVCVDDSAWFKGIGALLNPPMRGKIYTVARIDTFGFLLVLSLIEYPDDNDGPSWWERRFFRPLSETRLDQFRQHLAPQPREEVPV